MNRIERVLSSNDTRPQDDVGLQGLLHEATDADFRETRRILRLITEHGFARDRDLQSRFDEALTRWRPSTRSD